MASSRRDLVPVTASTLRDGDSDGSLMRGRRVVGEPRALDNGRYEVTVRWGGTGRTEKLTIKPDWSGRVRRQVVGPGRALRHRGRARTTGRTVEVWDTAHPDSPVTPDQVRGQQWAMRCSDGTAVGRATLKAATRDVDDPRLWCVACVEHQSGMIPLPLPL